MTLHQSWVFDFFAGYIVPPCRGQAHEDVRPQIKGSSVKLDQTAANYFLPLFDQTLDSCTMHIAFTATDQQNPIRNLIENVVNSPIEDREVHALSLALELSLASDRRSKTGLFVVAVGHLGQRIRVALFKFAADESIQAIFSEAGMSISLVESAFSRSTDFFKAAVFDTNMEAAFWRGKAEDRQANQRVYEISNLWVAKFLQARPELTNDVGSRSLAKTLKKVINQSVPGVQQDLIAAARTIKSQADRNITLGEFAENYLPASTRDDFLASLEHPSLVNIPFQINSAILLQELKFETIELDNQFTITGPVDLFENREIITQAQIADSDNVEFRIRGRVLNRKIRVR